MTRDDFEEMISEIKKQLVERLDFALDESFSGKDEIDQVILCGGGANMPWVQKLIQEFFEEEVTIQLD